MIELTKMTPEEIEITDDMRIWALALVAARKKNKEEMAGFSDVLIDAMSIADAFKDVPLTEIEELSIKALLKTGRLQELADWAVKGGETKP